MQKPASLTRLYETASLLHVPSKWYIFQSQQYKNPLQRAYNLSVSEKTGKMNLAIRIKLNQDWVEQDKKKGETELVLEVHPDPQLSLSHQLPGEKTRNSLHLAQDMPSQNNLRSWVASLHLNRKYFSAPLIQ